MIVDKNTGEILDDTQGYGYKSRQSAHKGYTYKSNKKVRQKHHQDKKVLSKWFKNN